MIACVQRVSSASVTIDSDVTGSIGRGLLVLLGVEKGDTDEQNRKCAQKVMDIRIFPDDAGKMSLSVEDIGGEILVVSQFTLAGDCRKGRRPDFGNAMQPDVAEAMYEDFVALCRQRMGADRVATGRFAASMQVQLVNDGPVTILVEVR